MAFHPPSGTVPQWASVHDLAAGGGQRVNVLSFRVSKPGDGAPDGVKEENPDAETSRGATSDTTAVVTAIKQLIAVGTSAEITRRDPAADSITSAEFCRQPCRTLPRPSKNDPDAQTADNWRVHPDINRVAVIAVRSRG